MICSRSIICNELYASASGPLSDACTIYRPSRTRMIYIESIKGLATGGTEVLHQLFRSLKIRTPNVRMHYRGDWQGEEIPERFREYQVEKVDAVDDVPENLIVIPETAPELISQYKSARKVLWWLSVDNFFFIRKRQREISPYTVRRLVSRFIKDPVFKDKSVVHLTQSDYASDFLCRNGIANPIPLSDYLNEAFLRARADVPGALRQDVVLYNPAKGADFTRQIIAHAQDVKFEPIQNMIPEQIIEKMKMSKVYIDFGAHPGKDRIPREAAWLGCVVITGRRGAAAYEHDIPIPEASRISDSKRNIPRIVKRIREAFGNYPGVSREYDDYRRMIALEKDRFDSDVDHLWRTLFHRYSDA